MGALKIAGYTRVSFDEDGERYGSIINQSSIIKDYAKEHFGANEVDIFEDDNYSGYKFDRPAFTKLIKEAKSGKYDVILAKDLSRIGRHNARTLIFMEDMEFLGKRVIAINDNIDTSNMDNDITMGVKTWYNELYVKDISRKIKTTIDNKQKNAKWICSVPYGYRAIDYKTQDFVVDQRSAEVIRKIYELYIGGWGYKKIAAYLTEQKIPTPRMIEKEYKEAKGEIYRKKVSNVWSIVSVQGVLKNDFYIGTLRTKKYSRKGINGSDQKLDEDMHNVFLDNHESIIDKDTYNIASKLMEQRSSKKSFYRGTKKYDNVYSGLIACGDCGRPMFSISNAKRPAGYICGEYHKRGKSVCTSHHIHEETLNRIIKTYIKGIRRNCDSILVELDKRIKNLPVKKQQDKDLLFELKRDEEKTRSELKALSMQKLRQIMTSPELEGQIDEVYGEMEKDLMQKLDGLNNQIAHAQENKSDEKKDKEKIIDAIGAFDKLLSKDKFTKRELIHIIKKIYVYEDRVDVELVADVSDLFNLELSIDMTKTEEGYEIVQKMPKHADRIFGHNVISNGDPLEIYTDREGGVILKKYSPIGELFEYAREFTDSINKTLGHTAIICDRDMVVAASGINIKSYRDAGISEELNNIIGSRKGLVANSANKKKVVPVISGEDITGVSSEVIAPVLSEGQPIGAIVIMSKMGKQMNEVEEMVAKTASGFMGMQMEQ